LLTCRDVLEFATVEGARCNGLERRVGTLTPGKDADILRNEQNEIPLFMQAKSVRCRGDL
jgi:imidazolonepropionase-like amidohydrolase